MLEIKTFKLERSFSGTEALYRYLTKDIEFIGESIGIQIDKPLRNKPFCIVGCEKITERNILFFASESEFPENLGELIVLASTFDVDIVVFFLRKVNRTYLECLNWLQKICNPDTEFIACEVNF